MDITISDPDIIQDDDQIDAERQLSDNVLVVDISGPDVHSLSIVDFPGFMHSMLHLPYVPIDRVGSEKAI